MQPVRWTSMLAAFVLASATFSASAPSAASPDDDGRPDAVDDRAERDPVAEADPELIEFLTTALHAKRQADFLQTGASIPTLRKRLGPRASECIPVLEAWLDTLCERPRASDRVNPGLWVPRAYAALRGDSAVPRLAEVIADPESRRSLHRGPKVGGGAWWTWRAECIRVLLQMDTRASRDAFDQAVRSLHPTKDNETISSFLMWMPRGGDVGLALARRWIESPPKNLWYDVRRAIIEGFFGNADTREWAWTAALPRERLRLAQNWWMHARDRPELYKRPEWRARVVTEVRAGLSADDPAHRLDAAVLVASNGTWVRERALALRCERVAALIAADERVSADTRKQARWWLPHIRDRLKSEREAEDR